MSASHSHPALLSELRALYARADALYADWACSETSAECCRFGITGRQPYVTSIEFTLLQHSLAALGGPPMARRRALPVTADAERERICPLLDRAQRCSVYAERPLGCRTYFCERAKCGAGPSREALRDLFEELQDLAARHRLGGERARPLMRALEGG